MNFDAAYFERTVPEAISRRNALLEGYKAACKEKGVPPASLPPVALWVPAGPLEAAGVSVGIIERRAAVGEESAWSLRGARGVLVAQCLSVHHSRLAYSALRRAVGCLQELVMNGIKGTAAYACHAMEAGVEEEGIYAALHDALAMLGRGEADASKLVVAAMAVGTCNVAVMKALDSAHVARFGSPVPRAVNTAPQEGKVRRSQGHGLGGMRRGMRRAMLLPSISPVCFPTIRCSASSSLVTTSWTLSASYLRLRRLGTTSR